MTKKHIGVENITINELPNSSVEIKGEISWENFKTFEKKAFERLSEHLEIDGFRKGNVPENIAKKHLGDELILSDMAELALGEAYPAILEEKKIDAIGRPTVSITKLARDNSLGFTLTTAILPDIKLPDYKKLAKNAPAIAEVSTTEEEIDKVIEDLRQMRAYGHVHDHTENDHGHTEPLPEVDDAFAQSFGAFKTVAELRAKIKENVLREKEQNEKDKRRIAIMDSIISETKFPVPEIILQSEQEKMIAQIESDVLRSGMEFDAYLEHTKKTRADLMEEFKPEAERRARFQMCINAISKDMGVQSTDEEVEAEAQKLMQMYPGADLARTKAYADMMLVNEKVLSSLENL
jgi:FKBP-type peptidyl-prolyl cis-trans isomerase (trigger factor)